MHVSDYNFDQNVRYTSLVIIIIIIIIFKLHVHAAVKLNDMFKEEEHVHACTIVI